MINPRLKLLQPYPFERLKKLLSQTAPAPTPYSAISLGIGEPKHPTPEFIKSAMTQSLAQLSHYPVTAGEPQLRTACAQWLQKRYGLSLDKDKQILPTNGSREALFALAQVLIDGSKEEATVVCPNPFYQIYEGAALLAGAKVAYAPSVPAHHFAIDWASVPEQTWRNTQLVYVCSPSNPTGSVLSLGEWQILFALSDKYGFVICADECYSEIYIDDKAPLGALEAAHKLGRKDYARLIVSTSLSKRSNVPGLRSGFVAGDAKIIEAFLKYRTYHGSAMGGVVQAASIAAWSDESHVEENRALYRQKFRLVVPLLQNHLEVSLPDASFYLWAKIPEAICGGSDEVFAQKLYCAKNVTVLPGSYLGREHEGHNPAKGYIRMALVADTVECVEAATRIVDFCQAQVA